MSMRAITAADRPTARGVRDSGFTKLGVTPGGGGAAGISARFVGIGAAEDAMLLTRSENNKCKDRGNRRTAKKGRKSQKASKQQKSGQYSQQSKHDI